MTVAVKITRGRVPWAHGVAKADPMRELLVYPPIKSQACCKCQRRLKCWEYDKTTGHIMCEPLSYWDLWCAERDGVLDELIWWKKLPESWTADDVVRVMGRDGDGPAD